MFEDYRKSKYYKICGVFCGSIAAINLLISLILLLSYILTDGFSGVFVLMLCGAFTICIFLPLSLIFTISFPILTLLAILKKDTHASQENEKFNKIADIGYIISIFASVLFYFINPFQLFSYVG